MQNNYCAIQIHFYNIIFSNAPRKIIALHILCFFPSFLYNLALLSMYKTDTKYEAKRLRAVTFAVSKFEEI